MYENIQKEIAPWPDDGVPKPHLEPYHAPVPHVHGVEFFLVRGDLKFTGHIRRQHISIMAARAMGRVQISEEDPTETFEILAKLGEG